MVAYNEYRFYEQTDYFVLEPVTTGSSQEKIEVVIFHRDAGSIELADKLPKFLTEPKVSTVYGMLGVIRLLSGDHILLITDKEQTGTLAGHSILKIKSTKIYPFARNALYLTPEQAADEEHYRSLLEDFLAGATLYYSNTLDLTRNLQNQPTILTDASKLIPNGTSLIDGVNQEFFWNKSHLQPFLDITKVDANQNFANFYVPVIYGYVNIKQVTINNTQLNYGLITRRGTSRVGTRFFSRGADTQGNVSNFVETEQIFMYPDNAMASFVQTRGSIPFFWAQVTNTKYTPKLVIDDRQETTAVFQKHFKTMNDVYGPVVAVNLINTKGYELPMGQKFAHYAQLVDKKSMTYVHFDFHLECSKMRWHRIQLLIDQLAPHLDEHGYFYNDLKNGGGNNNMKQSGVIRTNCMDCLDRTNVVQSMVAKHILNQQLKAMGVVSSEHTINNFTEDFDFIFRNMWADNADAVSVAYSGTGALKTDFTRTGKRTPQGPLQDGYNSVVRYIKNNYLDGSRQDGIDLFLGKFKVSQADPSPFQSASVSWRVQAAFGLLFSGLAIIFSFLLGLIPSRLSLLVGLGMGMIMGSIRLVMLHGGDFVDRPRLIKYEYDPAIVSSRDHTVLPVEKSSIPIAEEPHLNTRLTTPAANDRSKAD